MKIIAPKEFTNVTYGKEGNYSIITTNVKCDDNETSLPICVTYHLKDGSKQCHFAMFPNTPTTCKFYVIDEPADIDYYELEILR